MVDEFYTTNRFSAHGDSEDIIDWRKSMTTSINKNIFFIGLVSFFTDFSTAIITPILPIFVIEYLHAGYSELGVIIAISTFITYIVRLFSGYISDRFQIVKPLVVGGYLISGLSKSLFYFVTSWGGVAFFQSLERFGKGVREAPRDSLISHFGKTGGSGKAFGFHRMMDTSGHFLGALTLFLTLFYLGQSKETIKVLFLLCAIPSFIGVLILVFFVKDTDPKAFKIEQINFSQEDKKLLFPIVIYAGFTAFLFSESFFVMRAKESGFETYQIPLLFMAYTLSQALLSYPIGKLIDTIGSQKVLMAAYAIGICTTLLLYQGSHIAMWFAYIGFGIYTTASLNSIRSVISEKASNKALTYGVFYTVLAFAIFVSSIVIGLIWDHYDAQSALLFSLLGTILFFFIQLIIDYKRRKF